MTLNRALFLAALLVFAVACGDDDEGENNANNINNANNVNNANNGMTIEVAGTWESNFATVESISDTEWNGSAITQYDNNARLAITQNAADAEFSPSAFNKIVWTAPEGDVFYYCTIAFGLETEQEAVDAEDTSDDSDPLNSGCGGFGWTQLTKQ